MLSTAGSRPVTSFTSLGDREFAVREGALLIAIELKEFPSRAAENVNRSGEVILGERGR